MQRVLSAVTFVLFLLVCLHFSLGHWSLGNRSAGVQPETAAVQPEAAKAVEITAIEVIEETVEIETTAPAEVDTGDLPDFGAIADVKEKKETFFSFIRAFAEEENRKIIADRQRIITIRDDLAADEDDLEWVQALARRYRMSPEQVMDEAWFDDLLKRVDQLPVSMVLAQAANESGWGTSRFARQGNNLFGQWCFSSGCGIVPEGRPEGASYEVRRFDSVGDSVAAYFLNLNTHPGYEALRELRRNGRDSESFITGLYLAQGLHVYSERGHEYVEEISSMIRYNDLIRYDAPTSAADASAVVAQDWLDRSSS